MQNYTDALIDDYLIKEDTNQELNEWIDQSTFDSIKPGDIIIANIYQYGFKDHSARPVLVTNKSATEVYGLFITSSNGNENMDFYKVPIRTLAGTGLTKDSYVNLTRTVNIKAKFISGPKPVIGRISRDDLDKIIEHLSDIYYVRQYPFKYDIGLVIKNLKDIEL